jgi:hypothetical protein
MNKKIILSLTVLLSVTGAFAKGPESLLKPAQTLPGVEIVAVRKIVTPRTNGSGGTDNWVEVIAEGRFYCTLPMKDANGDAGLVVTSGLAPDQDAPKRAVHFGLADTTSRLCVQEHYVNGTVDLGGFYEVHNIDVDVTVNGVRAQSTP